MSRIVLSHAARIDRQEITAYTVEQFGVGQARRLKDLFRKTLTNVAESPHLGRTHPELDPPGRSFRYWVILSRFAVVYEPTESGIRVARILHGARNLATELGRDPGDRE